MPQSETRKVPFTYRREIFWGDTDTARIVYTGKFADYILEAVEAWMRAYLGTDWFRSDRGRGTRRPDRPSGDRLHVAAHPEGWAGSGCFH